MYKVLGLLVLYKSYSLFKYTQQESVITFKEILDNGEQNTLLTDWGVDAQKFEPSYLLLSGVAQTLYAGIISRSVPSYEKEYLMLPDGGQISLQSHILPENSKGIIVIIPGIWGDGETSYIAHSVKKAKENGYSSIVVNHRGWGNTKLLTPLTYHAGSSFDTKEAINYIESKHPGVPLYGLSFSLGSNILGRYIAEESSDWKLKGAVVVWCPFDAFEWSVYSEKSCFGLVSRYLAWSAMK